MIDSYSESSDLADEVAVYPPWSGNFTVWELIFDSYTDSSDVADQVADLPHQNGNFRILLIYFYS